MVTYLEELRITTCPAAISLPALPGLDHEGNLSPCVQPIWAQAHLTNDVERLNLLARRSQAKEAMHKTVPTAGIPVGLKRHSPSPGRRGALLFTERLTFPPWADKPKE